jgi:ABC-type glycerol-3-phosphate transport system substrate-binding protein
MIGAFSIVACGGGGDNTPAEEEGGDDTYIGPDPLEGKNVTIRFDSQWGGNMQTMFNNWAEEFEELHPGVTVEVNKISGDYSDVAKKEMSDLQTGNDDWGDIVSCYPDHVVDYLGIGKCVDLKKFIENENEGIALGPNTLKDLTPAAKEYFNIEYPAPGMYCAPFSVSTEFMLYNKEILEWTIPGVNNGNRITEQYLESLTWDEFFNNFCPKFLEYNESKPDNEKILITKDGDYSVLGYDDDANAFITLLAQYGYPYTSLDSDRYPSIDFNTQEARDLAKRWNFFRNHKYILTEGSNNNTKPTSLLGSKKVLFAVGSTGGITYQQSSIDSSGFNIQVGCTIVPQANPRNQKIVLQGGSLCILSHNSADDADRQLAAWMFYKYITNKTNTIRWAMQTGYAPIRKSVYKTGDWNEIISTEGKNGIELLTALSSRYVQLNSKAMFLTPVFRGSKVCREQVDGLFAVVLNEAQATCTDEFVKAEFDKAYNNVITNM